MFKFLNKKDRKLGVAENVGRYDLPLKNCAGSTFLMMLVALMSFLAMMAMTGSFVMHGVTERWSSGLENQATIEIPARESGGEIRSADELEKLGDLVSGMLDKHPNIESHTVMARDEVNALIAPWLGEDIPEDGMPLPALITVKFRKGDEASVNSMRQSLKSVNEDIRLDTHESWLNDILRLAGSLQFAAVLVTLIIGLTTVIAIAGAVRSRMAEFKADIQLLHLMGAGPNYISRQFQRHSVILSLRGSLIGLAIGGVGLLLFGWLASAKENALVPSLSLGGIDILTLLLLPVFVCAIAYFTARFTVLRTLSALP